MLAVQISWKANIRNRQVKSPKVYIRGSGILHEAYRVFGLASRLVGSRLRTPLVSSDSACGLRRYAMLWSVRETRAWSCGNFPCEFLRVG